MFRPGSLLLIAIIAGLLVGCDHPKATMPEATPATTGPSSVPATEPAADAPATQPTTQSAASQLMIDGQIYEFPDARLRVGKSASHVIARLYSDDPKAALEDDYKGNHYDIQMRLDDIDMPQLVYTSTWQFKAQSEEYNNSPYGIFLDGMRYQLQPIDVSARFLGTVAMVRVDLEGQFLLFDDSDKSAAPKSVYVKGSLLAPVEYKD